MIGSIFLIFTKKQENPGLFKEGVKENPLEYSLSRLYAGDPGRFRHNLPFPLRILI